VSLDDAAGADLDLVANAGVGANFYIFGQLGRRRDDCG
jgi:hypothetical protein